MKVRVTPSNRSLSSNEENFNEEDIPGAANYRKPPSKNPLCRIYFTLLKEKRFALNKMFQQNISKLYFMYKKTKLVFSIFQ